MDHAGSCLIMKIEHVDDLCRDSLLADHSQTFV